MSDDAIVAKFIPPQQNPLLTRLLQSIFGVVAYFAYKFKIKVSDRDLAQLKAISQQRVVYLPNHSHLDDGLVMFLFSARLGQLFHYVVAREAFRGWVGKLMQLVGAYSIRRGVGDRSSIVQTLKIMQQPQCKLVIFPEGGCSYQNDTLIPFRTGGIELAFKTLEKLLKQDPATDLYLVPVSLKYTYPDAGDRQIAAALQGLETALAIVASPARLICPPQSNCRAHTHEFGDRIRSNSEAKADWNQRIASLKQHLLNYCETSLELNQDSPLPNRERVYKVQAMLREVNQGELPANPDLDYSQLEQTTVRLLNFDAICDGYVAAKPTKERFFATLDRLEREVYRIDRPQIKGLRQIEIITGTPINLREYCDRGQTKSQAVEQLIQTIQQTVEANLQ